MKYVGQTKCRLRQRHLQHINSGVSYIDRALRKYGEENFTLEILEDNIDDADVLNEREIYWISYYDSFNNGYNLTKGGEGVSTFNEDDAAKIRDLLRNSTKTMLEISNDLGYSLCTISDINTGLTCYKSNIDYPIRKNRATQKFYKEDFENVIYFLKNTEFSFNKIAELTNTNFYFVSDTNRGKISYDYIDTEIPVRPYKFEKADMTKELALSIVKYLKQDLSAEEVAGIVGVPPYTVGQINRGKSAICKELQEEFPIQKRQHRNREMPQKLLAKLTPDNVYEIVELLLNTTLSTEEIARRFGVNKSAINRINSKRTWKNLLTDYEAPIRTNPKNKKIA